MYITPFDRIILMQWWTTAYYSDGVYVKTNRQEALLKASVQRLSMAERQLLPEGFRSRQTYKIYTEINSIQVLENTSTLDAAEFVFDNQTFAMLAYEQWELVMPHWKLTVVEKDG